MMAEYPETDPVFFGAERLGRFVGRSGRWVREREIDGVIARVVLNGGSWRERPLYSADETLPKLVAFLATQKGPSPEAQQLAAQRVEAGRLKLEAARLELDKLKGEVIEMDRAKAIIGDLGVKCRQRLMHLPGAVKTTLGLDASQTLGLQKEIRAALTDLAKGKGATHGEAAIRKRVPQRRRRSKQPRA